MDLIEAPVLTIAYSTLYHRAANIRLPAPRPGIEILVLVQGAPADAPPLHRRSDLQELHLDGTGVARSRNAAIDHAHGRYLLFADDDIDFLPDGIAALCAALDADPDLTLVTGQTCGPDGALRKRFSLRAQALGRLNSAKTATYEMMLRLAPVRASGLRFDEAFGAGMPNFIGDEYIFVTDLLDRGLKARFVPVTVAIHPTASSGLRWSGPAPMRARKALFRRVFGRIWPIPATLFVLRNWQRVERVTDLRHLFL